MIIAIDFDGTIAEHLYPEVGALRKDAKEVIKYLYSKGHEIIIWTCRYGATADLAKKALDEWGIPYHKFNEHIDHVKEEFGNDTRKIFAHVYIDDRNLGGIPSWKQILKILISNHGV